MHSLPSRMHGPAHCMHWLHDALPTLPPTACACMRYPVHAEQALLSPVVGSPGPGDVSHCQPFHGFLDYVEIRINK